MTTQKRKVVPEIPPTSGGVTVKEPPAPETEIAETPLAHSSGSAGDPAGVTIDQNGGAESAAAAAERATGSDLSGADAPAGVAADPGDGRDDDRPADPGNEPAATADPLATDPLATDPLATDPLATDPLATDPLATDPLVTDPLVTAEPGPADEASALTRLTERIAALEEAFALQRQSVADVAEGVQDRIAGSVAAEVERFTTDELVDTKRNLSLAAHSMAHLALGITESADNITAELGPDSIIALLQSFRTEVDNVLLQLGYSPLDTRPGERFDPNRHRSLRRIPTGDAGLDRLIARVIRDGYRGQTTKRILVYSDVEVHRYQS